MRELKATKNNLILIQDNISGAKIGFLYDTVKTSERLAYQSESIKIFENSSEVERIQKFSEFRLDFVLNKITGFTDGSFSVDGKAISSDPNSENYYSDWKLFLKENASDLIDTAASLLFNMPNQLLKKHTR